MTHIVYRLAREEDLETTYLLFRSATNDLLRQRNLPLIPVTATPPPRSMAFRKHAYLHDAARFWIAEIDDRPVGFGIATLREHLWYLAALHVLPECQGRGIGGELLRRCLACGETARAHVVISDSINPHSNALYARHGLYQQLPLIELTGTAPSAGMPGIELIPPDRVPWNDIDRLDRGALGATRREDHALWLTQETQVLFGLRRGGELLAYGYASAAGVGPAAAVDQAALAELLLGAAAAGPATGDIAVKLPGNAEAAIAALLRAGFKYHHILLLNASQPLHGVDRYAVSAADALL